MKIIDETETQKRKRKRTEKDKVGEDKSCIERVRAKWFCCAFKLGFHQLICKTSSIFKSNLELPLSIILNRENYTCQIML